MQPLAEKVADDLTLLFDPVAHERPSRLDRVAVPAEEVTAEEEVEAALVLPDVGHFMDEQALVGEAHIVPAEIRTVERAFGMEMDCPARCHDRAPRLEREEFVVGNPNLIIIHCIPED
jgi:hypothetical protein